MTARLYCPGCEYPRRVCICDAIEPLANQVTVTVLQHPGETKHAKNTARLLTLGLIQCDVIVGEQADDFYQVQQKIHQCAESWALLYPAEHSRVMSSGATGMSAIKHLLLIDGTWKKAYKIWQLNPWLQRLPCWRIDMDNPGIYRRKAKWQGSLSTLECAAYALHQLEGLSPAPLLTLLAARQQRVTQQIPSV